MHLLASVIVDKRKSAKMNEKDSAKAEQSLQVKYEYFEDGHRPGNTQEKTRLAINTGKQSKEFLSVFDNLLSPQWCERAYDYAISRKGKPFGIYIQTQSEALNEQVNPEVLWSEGKHQQALGLVTTRALIFERGLGVLKNDVDSIHGTAVWCLSSGVTQNVEYHIDYAELFRYETNTIHPPLYAGTCQVSPLETGEMQGGDFCANMRGLEHYRRYGYKAKLSMQDKDSIPILDDLRIDPAWQVVRYRSNRGILHDGDLPHLSTPITDITEGKRRVIFGFNCFSKEVGESNVRAPEHSDAFNRTVKLYQALSGMKVAGKYDGPSDFSPFPSSALPTSGQVDNTPLPPVAPTDGKVRAKDVLGGKNPALAKLLVLAARKVKEHKALTGQDFLSVMADQNKEKEK